MIAEFVPKQVLHHVRLIHRAVRIPGLDLEVVGQEALRPEDDADADPAKCDREENGLDLRLTARQVYAEERHPGEACRPETERDHPFHALARWPSVDHAIDLP